ncbi:MAG: thrombospondin type 3 repeat-containing protein, partial [Flavobacteriales bacterium]
MYFGFIGNSAYASSIDSSSEDVLSHLILADEDGDGVEDEDDTCPGTPLGETVDTLGCSESQLDNDNDGVTNNLDLCPQTVLGIQVDTTGCAIVFDADNDGVIDSQDLCPDTPLGETVDTLGCSESQLDN